MVSGRSRDYVRELEAAGADTMWSGGHVASRNPTPEAIIGLSQLAAHTQSATVGTAVLLLPIYPPAIVAKQFADLDGLTGGRVVLGAGVGGEYATEFSACQVPVEERGRRFDEAIPLLRALWGGEPVTSIGPCFPMDEVLLHPGPVRTGGPPILIAGRKERAMRRAAELGDGWFPYMYSPSRYQSSVARVREIAGEFDRDLDAYVWALWTFVSVGEDGVAARRRASEHLQRIGHIRDGRITDHVTVSGTPNEVIRRLQEFCDAGVEHFVFATIDPEKGGASELQIQQELVPNLPRTLGE